MTSDTQAPGPDAPDSTAKAPAAELLNGAALPVTTVRLLGCETTVTDAGQRTLRMLSHTLRLPVFGTTKPLLKSHSNSAGFDPAFAHILIEATALTGGPTPCGSPGPAVPWFTGPG